MITLRYGYSSRGVDGRTDHEDEKTFANVYQAEDWAWAFVRPGEGMHGTVEVAADDRFERFTHFIEANWRNALDPEPYTVYVWAEWTEEK